MARKSRLLVANASYHVFAQINRRDYFLEDENIKDSFLDVLRRAKGKYNFSIRNFCIMDNHIHLDITPGDKESLSRIMQWIMSMFARVYNSLKGQVGRVWRGRFKSRVIETLSYAIKLFMYISNNPVRAGKVNKAENYKYCGLFDLLNCNYSILDPPEGEFGLYADVLMKKNTTLNIAVIKASAETNSKLGFYPGKPGRKRY